MKVLMFCANASRLALVATKSENCTSAPTQDQPRFAPSARNLWEAYVDSTVVAADGDDGLGPGGVGGRDEGLEVRDGLVRGDDEAGGGRDRHCGWEGEFVSEVQQGRGRSKRSCVRLTEAR